MSGFRNGCFLGCACHTNKEGPSGKVAPGSMLLNHDWVCLHFFCVCQCCIVSAWNKLQSSTDKGKVDRARGLLLLEVWSLDNFVCIYTLDIGLADSKVGGQPAAAGLDCLLPFSRDLSRNSRSRALVSVVQAHVFPISQHLFARPSALLLTEKLQSSVRGWFAVQGSGGTQHADTFVGPNAECDIPASTLVFSASSLVALARWLGMWARISWCLVLACGH